MRAVRLAVLALALSLLVTGCGRSHVAEAQLEELAKEYTQALIERRFDDAKKLLTGEALQAAEVAFPMLQVLEVKQKLLEIEAEAEPVEKGKTVAAVRVRYRVETEVPGFGTTTERVTARYEFAKLDDDQWRLARVTILESVAEGAQ